MLIFTLQRIREAKVDSLQSARLPSGTVVAYTGLFGRIICKLSSWWKTTIVIPFVCALVRFIENIWHKFPVVLLNRDHITKSATCKC